MKINKKLVTRNFSSRHGSKIEYIVIHDTGNEKPLATAEAHYNYFNNGDRSASAHYFVDEKQILQIIDDSNSSWHVGDGKGKYGILNRNSIGIEICINDGEYTTEIKRTIELTKHLMNKYNIPIENVVRHYDASRKNCPAKLSKNDWEAWRAFKIQLERELKKSDTVTAKRALIETVKNGKLITVDGLTVFDENNNATNYIPIRSYEEQQGNKVGWDNVNKRVVVNG